MRPLLYPSALIGLSLLSVGFSSYLGTPGVEQSVGLGLSVLGVFKSACIPSKPKGCEPSAQAARHHASDDFLPGDVRQIEEYGIAPGACAPAANIQPSTRGVPDARGGRRSIVRQ